MRVEDLVQSFKKQFGETEVEPAVFFAPGRVNLIGEHTDYNGGHVFPCALTLGTYGVMRKRTDSKCMYFSENFPKYGVVEGDLNHLVYEKRANWTNYCAGVVKAFEDRGFKLDTGFDFLIYGNIPSGSGLSSSAALEVLTGTALDGVYGFDDLSKIDIALIGQESENAFCGLNCGIMDQFASSCGKKDSAIFLDTATLEYTYVPVKLDGAKIVIVNSKVKHSLVDSAYNERRATCEAALEKLQTVVDIKTLCDLKPEEFENLKYVLDDEIMRKRAKHAIYENARTIEAVAALGRNDLTRFGELMNESHISLRDDYETSCEETDLLAEIAWSIDGVYGSRITGGGFGGCIVSIVKDEAIPEFKRRITSEYKAKTPEIYVVEIGDGAHAI